MSTPGGLLLALAVLLPFVGMLLGRRFTGFVLRGAHAASAMFVAYLDDARHICLNTVCQPRYFHQQDRCCVKRQVGVDVGLHRLHAQSVHHLQRGGHQPRGRGNVLQRRADPGRDVEVAVAEQHPEAPAGQVAEHHRPAADLMQ